MSSRRGRGPSLSFFAFQDIITAVVGIFILIIIILILELVQRVEAASTGSLQATKPLVEAVEALEAEIERMREELETRRSSDSETMELNAFNRDDKLEQLQAHATSAEHRIDRLRDQIRAAEREKEKAEAEGEKLSEEGSMLDATRQELAELKNRESKIRQQIEQLSEDASGVFRDRLEDGTYLTLVTLSGAVIEVRDALTKSSDAFSGPRRLDEMRSWLRQHVAGQRHFLIRIKPGGAGDFQALEETWVQSGVSYGYTVVGGDEAVRLGFELEPQP